MTYTYSDLANADVILESNFQHAMKMGCCVGALRGESHEGKDMLKSGM